MMTDYLIGATIGLAIGVGMMMQYGGEQQRKAVGAAFGCGMFYAGDFDPARDPRDERSPCYPYYKAWEAGLWHPSTGR